MNHRDPIRVRELRAAIKRACDALGPIINGRVVQPSANAVFIHMDLQVALVRDRQRRLGWHRRRWWQRLERERREDG